MGPPGGSGKGTSCSIFIGNVPYDAQEDELREIFEKVGSVVSVRVVCDKETKQPKGYAFCDFSDNNAVQAAVEKLNNVEYNGRKLRIDGAERELHGTSGSARAIGDRDGGDRSGPGPPPRGKGGASSMAPVDTGAPLPPVQTVADRLALLRDQEAAQQARVLAAENAERAEIGRLMETLTPQQVIHILAEMQRLTIRAPEVARALLTENQQLALALQHAEFLAGMIEEAPVPTEPEVRERALSVREKIWGTAQAPAQPHPSKRAGPYAMQPGLLALPTMGAQAAGMLPFGATAPASAFGPSPTMGFMQTAVPPAAAPTSMVLVPPAFATVPAAVAPPPGGPPVAPGPAAPQPIPPAVLSQVLGAAAANEASRQSLMDQLAQLSPAEIDRLPHETKAQLLDFLQQNPP